MTNRIKNYILSLVVAFIVGLVLLFIFSSSLEKKEPTYQGEISTFEECVSAGNPVLETDPPECRTNEGTMFVEGVDSIDEPIVKDGLEPDVLDTPIVSDLGPVECLDNYEGSVACGQIYLPVCGFVDNGVRCVTSPCPSFDVKTFGNGCGACVFGDAALYYNGACDDINFIICKETVTGFDPVEYARNNNGVCIEICPGNYDSYTSQIGIEHCIKHYGVEEITSWEECSRSSSSCNCVNAYETTRSEEISDATYRCVPEDYSSRLLFRAGIDRLDENGVQSVMIA
jgi:hypothetical protein